MDSPIPAKKPRISELRACESFKSEYAREFAVLLKNENFKILAQIVDAVFAIACSNAECERIFSLMNVQWTDERNRLKLKTVSRIVSLLINCESISCLKMFNYLKTVEGFAKKITSSEKYNFDL